MRNDPSVVALVERAVRGDASAWNEIVERYSSLVWSICQRYQVAGADADDIGATVWLRLVAGLATIREPAALPGWLATTTRRECLALLRHQSRQIPFDDQEIADQVEPEAHAWLLTEERRIALRDAFAQLPDRDRQLLSMLFSDPPVSYIEISSRLGMPIGSIGPTRRRCLARVRCHPAIAALLADERQLPSRRVLVGV